MNLTFYLRERESREQRAERKAEQRQRLALNAAPSVDKVSSN